METNTVIITKERKPNIVKLQHWNDTFGEVEEITSRNLGAERANVVKVTLQGRDILHSHKEAEETYVCLEGEGELFLDDQIVKFVPGVKVIIKPGTVHAARPKRNQSKLVFLCISSPPFSSDDVINDPRGRRWRLEEGFKLIPESLSGIASRASFTLMDFREERGTLNVSEFKGSEDYEDFLKVDRMVEILERAKEASEKDSLDETTEEQRKAYQIVRATFFEEKVLPGGPGWAEWNTAIHKEFRKLMAECRWDEVKEGRESLRRFLGNPESLSPGEINKLRDFLTGLAVSFGAVSFG